VTSDNSQSIFGANRATRVSDKATLVPVGEITMHNFVADRSWAPTEKMLSSFSMSLFFSLIPFSPMSNPSHIKRGTEPANPFTPHIMCLAPEQLLYVTMQFWYL
jgi:hypothetical protein